MSNGTLSLHICNESGYPLAQAMIRIFQKKAQQIVYETFATSDEKGQTMPIALPCSKAIYSQHQQGQHDPFTTYHVEVHVDGYEAQFIKNVALFAHEHSILPVWMKSVQQDGYVLDTHVLADHYLRRQYASYPATISHQAKIVYTKQIPFFVRVHLDLANKEGLTYFVPFLDYVKNVAASMLYPTWHPNALKLCIIAITSTLLHYLFTKHYEHKGYPFHITNTHQDPLVFMPYRNHYTTIDRLVESVFNQYYVRDHSEIPLLLTFTTQPSNPFCLNFWEVQEAALQGYSFTTLMQTFLPPETSLVTTNHLQSVRAYPGMPLKLYQQGSDIAYVQASLSQLAHYYPSLKQQPYQHSRYDDNLAQSVHAFQQLFHLNPSHTIDQSTWYLLAYVTNCLTNLPPLPKVSMPITTHILQKDLNTLATLFPQIPTLVEDGQLKKQTLMAWYVFQYQLLKHIPIEQSIRILCESAQQIRQGHFPTQLLPAYPTTPMTQKKDNHIACLLDKVERHYPHAFQHHKSSAGLQTLLGIPLSEQINKQTWYLLHILAQQL